MKSIQKKIFLAGLALTGSAAFHGCAAPGGGAGGGGSLFGTMMNVPQQPQRRDTYAGLDMGAQPAAFPQLTLAVMLSENTKASIDYAYKGSNWANFDPRRPHDKEMAMLRRNFKAVVQVERVQDARTVNADLVLLIDNFAEVGRKTKLDYKTIFLTLDNQKIDELASTAERGMSFNVGRDVELVTDEVLGGLEAGLRASAPLAEFAKNRSGAAPAAKAPEAPAAPAPKRYFSDADKPSYRHPEDTRNFALVVGIEKYENLPAADFAERDAAAVRAHLLALGYPERNIIYLTGSKAGRTGIEKFVESWLPRNVGPEDRVFVYFSGHGAPDSETGQAYLVPWDGDAKFLSNTGYPVKRLYEKLNALKAKEILVALDACFSGSGGRSVLAKGTRPLVNKVDTSVNAADKIAVLSASASDEITGTDETQGHGIFTYYLLKGLNAVQGEATFQGLYGFLKPKVQDAARRDNRDQTPQLMPESAEARAPLKIR